MHPHKIIAIGDVHHADFQAASRWLEEQGAVHFQDGAQATAYLDTKPAPQWILLFSAQRSAYSQRAIERFHRRAPLAKLVHVCGSWCEGETRTGKPLAGVTRVSWNQFVSRAEAAIRRQADYAGWLLPRTATPMDIALQQRIPRRPNDAVVQIVADLREDYRALSESVIACGLRATRGTGARIDADARAILWNARSLDIPGQTLLSDLVRQASGLPLIALVDFPRQFEVLLAMDRGATAVLSKPLLLGDLWGAFARCGLVVAVSSARRAG